MELKNAIAVCLISLFSATLVVLIARALDSQAASQLEPQLTSIAEELRAIRKQGGVHVSAGSRSSAEPVADSLVVYYFHGNTRCDNCQAIESTAKETLDADFAAQLQREEVVWKVLNHEKPSGAALARKFDVKDPVVVLARVKDDQIGQWRRLDECMGLATDKKALAEYIRGEVRRMLGGKENPATAAPEPSLPPVDLPLPKSETELPLPK